MLISKTPFRISFLGGGTDYPTWYKHHGGAVLATTIDKYCYLTCRYLPPFFEHRFRIISSNLETCQTIDSIRHPSVKAVLTYLNVHHGLEIHHGGDLPIRSGIGSSSAFTVGLLHALYGLQGQHPSKNQLAQESIHVEQNILQETVGSQDQVCAAHGGLNHITFLPNGEILVQPVTIERDRIAQLNEHLMLFYTGISRTASEVASSYVMDLPKKHRQLHTLKELVNEGLNILGGHQPLARFGDLLHTGWQIKRGLGNKISNPQVDDLYDTARRAGAIGGKLIGAGGGGFLLLFVAPEQQAAVRHSLTPLTHVPFQFDFAGSQIIFSDGLGQGSDRQHHQYPADRGEIKIGQQLQTLDRCQDFIHSSLPS